jgi:acyl-CoA dehydrogenase
MRDLDFLLVVGHLFTLVVYGQLILEQADLVGLDADLLDQIFAVQIRDFSTYAVALHGKPSSTTAQQDWAITVVRKPVVDADRFDRVWEQVEGYDGAYEMRP